MASASSFARASAWFWGRVGAAVESSAESLGLFRVGYCLYLLLLDAPYFAWIDRAPRAFFEPPWLSLANLCPSFPPAPFFKLLDSVELLAVVCMGLGYRTRIATGVVLIASLVGHNFQFSFGKLDHPLA